MMKEMLIGNRKFDVNNNTYVCGILNVTPDSFSDGGSFVCKDKALRHVESMIKDEIVKDRLTVISYTEEEGRESAYE